jgi:hypothetical protein
MAEASGSQSMTLSELTEYNKYIIEIISRLHRENSLSLKETITPEGKMAFALEFRAPEWFRDLSEDLQEVAFDNLQKIMMERVSNIASDMGCVEQAGKCDCCEHTPKRSRC